MDAKFVIITLVAIISISRIRTETINCTDINGFIKPCKCVDSPKPHQYNILCYGDEVKETDLVEFHDFSFSFHLLHIQDTNITKIPTGTFQTNYFEQIFIEDNKLLTKIDENVFNNMPVKYLVIRNNHALNSSNIFNVSAELQPTFQIELQSDGITMIPENAFKNNTNVNHIFLHENNIRVISNRNTLKDLTNLTQLTLYNNQMLKIEGLEFNSNNDLSVFLNNNNLTDVSFNSSLKSNTTKAVKIFFQDNQFKSLEQKIFEPFVNVTNNELYFHNNEFDCYPSRMKWVKSHYNIFDVWCMNYDSSIFDTDL